jgi:hypothetical protein
LAEYAMTDNSDMAQKFHSMLETSRMENWWFQIWCDQKLQSGGHAFVSNKLSLTFDDM